MALHQSANDLNLSGLKITRPDLSQEDEKCKSSASILVPTGSQRAYCGIIVTDQRLPEACNTDFMLTPVRLYLLQNANAFAVVDELRERVSSISGKLLIA